MARTEIVAEYIEFTFRHHDFSQKIDDVFNAPWGSKLLDFNEKQDPVLTSEEVKEVLLEIAKTNPDSPVISLIKSSFMQFFYPEESIKTTEVQP